MKATTRLFSVAVSVAALFTATSAYAATVWVATNGRDTPTCGPSRSQACRSISAGIARANVGDLVLVGPGRYGDIDYDLQFVTPGDEAANPTLGCIVCIEKRVTVASTDGADATLIDAGQPQPGQSLPAGLNRTVVIAASGVRFGAAGQGFTVNALEFNAVQVRDVGDIRLIGNVVKGGISSFQIRFQGGPLYVAQNKALNATTGIDVTTFDGSAATVVDNFATGNSTGFNIGGNSQHTIASNKASRNGIGFFISTHVSGGGGYRISNNIASASDTGFVFNNAALIFQRNTAVGNEVGFHDFGEPNNPANSFHTNNMIGNFRCGFLNASGTHVDATNNFWGSAAGPAPKPSDAVCNEPFIINTPGAPPPFPSTTTVVPFATKAF